MHSRAKKQPIGQDNAGTLKQGHTLTNMGVVKPTRYQSFAGPEIPRSGRITTITPAHRKGNRNHHKLPTISFTVGYSSNHYIMC